VHAVLRRAIVVFVPPPVVDLVDEIRLRWDPVMTARIGAHITLIHDVVDQERARQLVAETAETTAPFRVRLAHADRWGPSAYGIYLHIEDPTGGLAALHGHLAALEQPAWSRVPFRSHVTLVHSRTVDAATADRAWHALDGFRADWSVDVGAIDVIELDEPGWRTVERWELGQAAVAD
jgi:2'-5' RNA ligase